MLYPWGRYVSSLLFFCSIAWGWEWEWVRRDLVGVGGGKKVGWHGMEGGVRYRGSVGMLGVEGIDWVWGMQRLM